MTTYSKALMLSVATMALMAGQAWAQGTPRVGIVSAVNPAAVGTPPGAETRPIVIGSDVIFREKVVTTGDGQAQLMFLDQSTMLIGPNSQVVIDEFVYDPNTSSGKFAATLTQGSFRYIGGKLSKQGDATLKTPVATIGIRGSDVIVNHNAGTNASGIQNIHGNATVESNGKTVKLPTGFGTMVNGPGQAPVYPESLTAAIINAAKLAFEGQPGKTAGAVKPPENADVEKSGLSGAVEARQLAGIETGAGGGFPNGGKAPDVPFVRNSILDQPGKPPGTPDAPPNNPPSNTPPVNSGGNTGGPIQSATMVGYVGGGAYRDLRSNEFTRPYFITNDDPSEVQINTHAPEAGAQVGTVDASITFRSRLRIAIQSATVQIGDASGSTGSSFLFANNQFSAFNPTDTATVNDATVQASIFLLTDSQATGNFTQIVQNRQNVDFCACEFMSWGFMVGELKRPSPNQRIDTILGTFVTGVLPNVAFEPTSTASFTGHVIGVSSTSGIYTAGSFRNDYNFSGRTGNFSISNFDGNNMSGTVNAGADWRHYSGGLNAGTGPASAGAVKGSFYVAPGTTPGTQPQGTGGNIVLTGPNGYAASATFVGKR